MNLNAPRQLYFVIAVLIALFAVLSVFVSALSFFPIPAFWTMTIAFVVLALACVIKGA